MPRIGISSFFRFTVGVLLAQALSVQSLWAQAQEQAVLNGIQYLRTVSGKQNQVGESAMIALALLKADAGYTDPVVATCIDRIRKRFTASEYAPQRIGGHDVYEAAVVAMALSNLDREEHRGEINLIATYLIGKQKPNGSWDYTQRPHGDTSISQYALLGLWECENAGYEVPPSVWDRAAGWFLSVQAGSGSWNYHRDQLEYADNLSMTSAGVGSLLLCKRQLEKYKEGRRGNNPNLVSLTPDTAFDNYEIKTSFSQIDQAARRGIAWLAANYTTTNTALIGQSIYYGLYGLERISAFADRQTLGRNDILEKARAFIRTTQKADGSWHASPQTDDMNTVWAILYLTKSTAKSIKRNMARKLGAGTLVGGRFLPKDLTSITVAGGKVMSRPMNGAVEGMLAVLEDPRSENAEGAVTGLIQRYLQDGPNAIRPFKERFRKLIKDPDPGFRQVAAWALSRMGDLDVVPDLIGAIEDPEENVVDAARQGLQLLSRKIEGLGPPTPSSPQQRKEAAARWRAWYESARPFAASSEDDDSPSAKPAGGPSR